MRILALLTESYGGYGGIAQYNRDLLSALSASSRVKDVLILSRLFGRENVELPPKLDFTRAVKSRVLYSSAAAHAALTRGPFDVIFCGHVYLCPLASLLSGLIRAPVWVQTHGIDAWTPQTRLISRSLESADLVTAVSRYTRHQILQWAAIEPHRVRVLPNTMRSANLDRVTEPVALPPEWKLKGRRYVITVARINRSDFYKGHTKVIDALAQLKGIYPDLCYVVVGEGDNRAALERYAAENGVADAVCFTAFQPSAVVHGLLRGAEAFVMPSTKEGFGIAFLEAAALGIPVIAGNRDGSVDALADGAIGTLIDPRDHAQLAAAITNVLEKRVVVPPKEVVDRFAPANFDRHADALLGLFETAAQSRKAA